MNNLNEALTAYKTARSDFLASSTTFNYNLCTAALDEVLKVARVSQNDELSRALEDDFTMFLALLGSGSMSRNWPLAQPSCLTSPNCTSTCELPAT